MTASNPTGAQIAEEQTEAMKLLDNKEVNQAALTFKNGVVIAKKMASTLPKKSVARVYNAFIEFPLGDKYPKFRDKKEQELFNLTLELITAKNKMIEAVVNYQQEIASKLEIPNGTNSENAETATGEVTAPGTSGV